jgi:potassium efflux system protein
MQALPTPQFIPNMPQLKRFFSKFHSPQVRSSIGLRGKLRCDSRIALRAARNGGVNSLTILLLAATVLCWASHPVSAQTESRAELLLPSPTGIQVLTSDQWLNQEFDSIQYSSPRQFETFRPFLGESVSTSQSTEPVSTADSQVSPESRAVEPAAARSETFPVQPATFTEETPKQVEATPAPTPPAPNEYTAQLAQLYEKRFAEPVPAELIDNLLKVVLDRKVTLEASETEEDKLKLESIKAAETRFAKAKQLKAAIEKIVVETRAAPEQIRLAEKDLSQPFEAALPLPAASLPISEFEAQVEQLKVKIAEDKARLQKVETQIKDRIARLSALAESKQASQVRLDSANQQLASLGFDPSARLVAIGLAQLSNAILSQVELEQLVAESERDNATAKLYPTIRDIEKRALLKSEEALTALSAELAARKQREKELLAQKTRLEAAEAHPRLRESALRNAELAELNSQVSRTNQAVAEELTTLETQLKELETSFEKLKSKVEVAGATQTVGMLLRKYRRHLPSVSRRYERVKAIESELPTLQLHLIEYEEDRERLTGKRAMFEDPNATADVLSLLSDRTSEDDNEIHLSSDSFTPELRKMALESFDTRTKVLDELIKDYEKQIDKLSEIELQSRALIERTNETRFFIDKHVLWIRSAEPLAIDDLKKSLDGFRSTMAINQWSDLTLKVRDIFRNYPAQAGLGFVVFIALFAFRGRLIKRLKRINTEYDARHITPLLRSMLLSVLLAAIYPAVLILTGWLLQSAYDPGSLKAAASHALLVIGPQFLIASLLHRISTSGGLAETRLQWNPALTRSLRKLVTMLTLFCFPLIFVYELMDAYQDGHYSDSLGRIGLIGAMIVLGLANMRAFRSSMLYLKTAAPTRLQKWVVQWRWLWLLVFVGGPIALAAFAAMGYSYSAIQLGSRTLMTFWAALLIIFGYSLISRIATIAQQAIAAGIRRRRYFEKKAKDGQSQIAEENHEEEIARINLQMQRLLRVSACAVAIIIGWQLWSEVLPAVQILDKVELGTVERLVTTETLDENNRLVETTETHREPITLNHAMMCLGVLVLTFVLSRNLPGLLQITFLNRLPIDRGGKYAISIVMRYVVAIAGSVFAFRIIGFTWDSLQWLVAAMSVGLGFGLQEIFGNFVSGLIILFERPVRVGDLVTVNGTTGWVTRIQLRATTITDMERRELVVPNKKFITDDVINWTLTDPITRMSIPVGIAYGSDTKLAAQTLLRVAEEHRLVLRDPAPSAHFIAFGNSTLDFQLRVFIGNRDHYPVIAHELHMNIDQAFREAGIEIAFPQQDLHLRTVSEDARMFFPESVNRRPPASIEIQEESNENRKSA